MWAVESVDSAKKADALEKGRVALHEAQAGAAGEDKKEGKQAEVEELRVFVQVNTSGEESKSGTEPGEQTVELCKHIEEKCPHLKLAGLMTIGAIARSKAAGGGEENEDFIALVRERDEDEKELGWTNEDEKEEQETGEGKRKRRLELSMGMSADLEEAIKRGSDEVRVGSTIFGERPPKGES